MDSNDRMYSRNRLLEAAGVFRNLSDTYVELAGEIASFPAATNAIVLQLNEMAEILDGYTGLHCREMDMKNEKAAITKGLRQRGIKTENIDIYECGKKGLEINIHIKNTKNRCIMSKELAGVISEATGRNFISDGNNRMMVGKDSCSYIYVEGGRYKPIFAMTKCNKNGNEVSGDNFSVEEINGNKTVVTLVDGMGAGKRANKDSRMVIELIERSLESGFSENAAIKLINSAFSINDIKGIPVALDMCVLDTYSGMCSLIKLGAAATFIMREGSVDIVQGNSLPLGVLDKVDFQHITKKIHGNDYIVMVSDGVIEALPFLDKEQAFAEILSEIKSRKPDNMVREMMECVKEFSGEYPKDDMTIIVVGMFEIA